MNASIRLLLDCTPPGYGRTGFGIQRKLKATPLRQDGFVYLFGR